MITTHMISIWIGGLSIFMIVCIVMDSITKHQDDTFVLENRNRMKQKQQPILTSYSNNYEDVAMIDDESVALVDYEDDSFLQGD
jgi:hypothetical protein